MYEFARVGRWIASANASEWHVAYIGWIAANTYTSVSAHATKLCIRFA